jgi:CubicO group peptidase (beta-lactamase class C family)
MLSILFLALAQAAGTAQAEPAKPAVPAASIAPDDAFPAAAPADVGLDPAALERICALVQTFVDEQAIVGAELVVIKKRRTVLRRTFGSERAGPGVSTSEPLAPRGIFCVRSMTKPVCGTAIEMLVDRGELALDDRIADHFHAFDHDDAAKITVEQLLHHTGGLPFSQFVRRPLDKAKDLIDVATFAGEFGTTLEPGRISSYSDDGADTCGALVELLSGKTLDLFLQEELFDPLGMKDTIGVLREGDPRIARVHPLNVGGAGRWMTYWEPGKPPIFKFLLASQSLYASCDDYARFLALWLDRGMANGKRLLSEAAIDRALAPGPRMLGAMDGFRGWRVHYGHFWMVYFDPKRPKDAQLVGFGHNGSDGTFAYAFPEHDLMVLYFTQSRQQGTGRAFEATLKQELLDPAK